jgi:hypothetical protein
MSGPWRAARRRLALTTRPWPAIRAISRSCSKALKDARQRICRNRLGTFLHSGAPKCFIH